MGVGWKCGRSCGWVANAQMGEAMVCMDLREEKDFTAYSFSVGKRNRFDVPKRWASNSMLAGSA